jgi:hypothetical protein
MWFVGQIQLPLTLEAIRRGRIAVSLFQIIGIINPWLKSVDCKSAPGVRAITYPDEQGKPQPAK